MALATDSRYYGNVLDQNDDKDYDSGSYATSIKQYKEFRHGTGDEYEDVSLYQNGRTANIGQSYVPVYSNEISNPQRRGSLYANYRQTDRHGMNEEPNTYQNTEAIGRTINDQHGNQLYINLNPAGDSNIHSNYKPQQRQDRNYTMFEMYENTGGTDQTKEESSPYRNSKVARSGSTRRPNWYSNFPTLRSTWRKTKNLIPRIKRLQTSSTLHYSSTDDLTLERHKDTTKEVTDNLEVDSKKQTRRTTAQKILGASLILSLVGTLIAVPVLVTILLTSGVSPFMESHINVTFTVKENFQGDLRNQSSELYKTTTSDICNEVRIAFRSYNEFLRQNFRRCQVHNLIQETNTVNVFILLQGTFQRPEDNIYRDALTTYSGTSGQFGSFTIISGSITIHTSYFRDISTTVEQTSIFMGDSLAYSYRQFIMTCMVYHAPPSWTSIKIAANDGTLESTAYMDWTVTQRPSDTHLVNFLDDNGNLTITLTFPNSSTHCRLQGNYTCAVLNDEGLTIEVTSEVLISGDSSDIVLEANGNYTEGEMVNITCSGRLHIQASLELQFQHPNTSFFEPAGNITNVLFGERDDLCLRNVSSVYTFLPAKNQNDTQMKCVVTNSLLNSTEESRTVPLRIF